MFPQGISKIPQKKYPPSSMEKRCNVCCKYHKNPSCKGIPLQSPGEDPRKGCYGYYFIKDSLGGTIVSQYYHVGGKFHRKPWDL